jgi:dimethylhistidine N-methyltransferase
MHTHGYADAALSQFAKDVRTGLMTHGQKSLPCRYFYDAVGTALFEAISRLPEYGLTRADDRLICAHAQELADLLPSPVITVELGSGTGAKTGHILRALARRECATYFPIDVSAAALDRCRRELSEVAEVTPMEATYLEGLEKAASKRRPGQHLLVLFLGSTIGNFERCDARQFLANVRGRLQPGDALLLGTDLEKPETRMLLAYDDPAGVTAAFNLNLLARVNRELGGNFNLREFVHEASYNRAERRVEMHLRSRSRQEVAVRDAEIRVEFEKGETIWTESSHKFRLAEVPGMAAQSGFRCVAQWVDEEWPFAESLLRPCGMEPA